MVLSNQSDLPAFFSPRKVNLKIGLIPEDDLPRKAIFRGQVIPACRKPEFERNFKLTFQGLKNPSKLLWLDKAILEIH
jgi:hypothetical protein